MLKDLKGKKMTLCELSNLLTKTEKFEDIFGFDIERDILDGDKGSVADIEGDIVIEFNVVEKSDSYLNYIVEII